MKYNLQNEIDIFEKDKIHYEKEWEKIKEEINSGIINTLKIGSIMHSLNCVDNKLIELKRIKEKR
jgi:hypothetical protein